MKWLIALLDFRLFAWQSTGEGGRTWVPDPVATPAPAPAPAPAEDPAPDFAANRQTANIDRTSRYSHGSYVKAIEGIDQQARAASPEMPVEPGDYTLPDAAFGERIY